MSRDPLARLACLALNMEERRPLLIAYVPAATYTHGGGVFQGLVQHPAWQQIGAAEFPAYHAAMSRGLGVAFLPFFGPGVLLSAVVLAWRPEIPRGLALAGVLLKVCLVAVTARVFFPL